MNILEQKILVISGAIDKLEECEARYCCRAMALTIDENSTLLNDFNDASFSELKEEFRHHAKPPFNGDAWWFVDDRISRIEELKKFLSHLQLSR